MNDKRHTYVWEYRVRSGSHAGFRDAYGPGGAWVELFRRASGHLETLLCQDPGTPDRYLTIDVWASEAAYRDFRRRFAAEYRELDEACAALTLTERLVGEFVVV